MTERICGNCRAFLPTVAQNGVCRLYPPRIINAPPPGDKNADISAHITPTLQVHVCLQHRHKGWRHMLDLIGWW
jgi:hypothetical protein